MNIITNPTVRTFYIAHSPATGVVHYGYVDPGQSLTANQNDFETFTDEALYAARLTEVGGVFDTSLDLSACPLPQQRILLNAQVNRIRAVKLSTPVSYMGHPFDADAEAIGNINGVLAAVGVGIPLPAGFSWRAADNTNVPMTAQQLVGLAGSFLVYRSKCYGASWAIKAAIAASDTPTTVTLDAGWPDPANPFA
jgi:hypothetical protein